MKHIHIIVLVILTLGLVAHFYFLNQIVKQITPTEDLTKQVQLQGQALSSIITLIQQAQQQDPTQYRPGPM